MAIAEPRREWSWPMCPSPLNDPASTDVTKFAAKHVKRVDCHKWLQFEIDRQLGEVAGEARARGMEIGLYQDLAVGSSGTGAETWTPRNLFLCGVPLGPPPGPYLAFGQNWRLP